MTKARPQEKLKVVGHELVQRVLPCGCRLYYMHTSTKLCAKHRGTPISALRSIFGEEE